MDEQYLNEVEEGGETVFPALNLTVTPSRCLRWPRPAKAHFPTHGKALHANPSRRYAALVFNNCLDSGEPDERTQHAALAPSRGVKYALNGWVRARSARPILDEMKTGWKSKEL